MWFPAKITSSCLWVAMPVDWVILHWYACGADGRSLGRAVGVRSRDYQIFSDGWVAYHIFLPMVLRCARFARKSFAINLFKIVSWRSWLVCIEALLSAFFLIFWSSLTNWYIIFKPLDIFSYKFKILEINLPFIWSSSFKVIDILWGSKIPLQGFKNNEIS